MKTLSRRLSAVETDMPYQMEALMRALLTMVVVTLCTLGLGAKLAFFSNAKANIKTTALGSSSNLQSDASNRNGLPIENFHDMTFVYPE